jgi:hypothetical protein
MAVGDKSEHVRKVLAITNAQAVSAQTGLKVFPYIATVCSMAAGAILHASGFELPGFVQGNKLGHYLVTDVFSYGILGCLGGFTLSFFGQAALHHCTIVDDAEPKNERSDNKGTSIETKIKIYRRGTDVVKGENSMLRTGVKGNKPSESNSTVIKRGNSVPTKKRA